MTGKQRRQLKTAGTGKRVVVVFGPPSVGASTVIDTLCKASETSTTIVPYCGRESILEAQEILDYVEVVFLDVDGGIFEADDVQRIVDNRLVYNSSPGAIIQVQAPDEVILERARDRPGYINEETLRDWRRGLSQLEARIRQHTLTYFMIPNIGLAEAVEQLALRSNISR